MTLQAFRLFFIISFVFARAAKKGAYLSQYLFFHITSDHNFLNSDIERAIPTTGMNNDRTMSTENNLIDVL